MSISIKSNNLVDITLFPSKFARIYMMEICFTLVSNQLTISFQINSVLFCSVVVFGVSVSRIDISLYDLCLLLAVVTQSLNTGMQVQVQTASASNLLKSQPMLAKVITNAQGQPVISMESLLTHQKQLSTVPQSE